MTDEKRVHKHGSGVGLVNVNNRIKIVFGKEYGIVVESEPDEGTTVSICIPAVLYTEENRKALEGGNLHEKRMNRKKNRRGNKDEEWQKDIYFGRNISGAYGFCVGHVHVFGKNEKKARKKFP